jgi:integrase/recombinase XerD
MGSIARPTYTRPVPKNAERCTVKDRPGVRWKGRGGKWVYGVVCEDNPARCRVEAQNWYCYYTDSKGKRRSKKGYADKTATEAMLAQIVQREARIHAGFLPPEAASAPSAIPDLLAEFERHLADSGSGPRYARDRALYALRVLRAAGVTRVSELTPAKVVRAVAAVREDLALSPLTAGYHLSATKQFTRWLALTRKSEPTDHLSGLPCKLDTSRPTFVRRALPPATFEAFVETTRLSEAVVRGLSGVERHALYLTAASTGLRASELAALTPGQFDLDSDPPTVTARAAYAKGRRHDELPLHDELVPVLRPLLAGVGAAEPVWPNRTASAWSAWWLEAAEMVALDLKAAGIPVTDAAGAVYDFHSLRGQHATDLARAGVGLAAAQKLMRHSTPKLTSNTYTRRSASELAAEVNKLRRKKT